MFQMKLNGNSGIPLWFPNLTCRWDQCVSVAAFRVKPNLEQRQSDRLFFRADKIGSKGFIFNSQRLLTKKTRVLRNETLDGVPGARDVRWNHARATGCHTTPVSWTLQRQMMLRERRLLTTCTMKLGWTENFTSNQPKQTKEVENNCTSPYRAGVDSRVGMSNIDTMEFLCGEISGPGSMTSHYMLTVSVVVVPCCSLSTF